jgi:integrase
MVTDRKESQKAIVLNIVYDIPDFIHVRRNENPFFPVPAVLYKKLIAERIFNGFVIQPFHFFSQNFRDFLFVTGYPMAKRPFYTHPNPADPRYSNGFDLLFRGLELVTGGQRLHRYQEYLDALASRGMSPEPFADYLRAFRYGMPRHGGFAIGIERFLMQLIGLPNLRLAAIRKLATEAADRGLLAAEQASAIARVKGAKRRGVRVGNWLTREQAQALLDAPDAGTVKGKRDRAVLALLIGCGLRRSEIAALCPGSIEQRDGRWVIVDLAGKGNRVRTVPVPAWVKTAIDEWAAAAVIREGKLFRSLNKGGAVWGDGITEKVVWWIVQEYAPAIGVLRLAPHDLRRTCAKLCRAAGGDLEQIQFLLGHASIQTTERYLGSRQNLSQAVNDNLGLG